jgi:hypothetical protein
LSEVTDWICLDESTIMPFGSDEFEPVIVFEAPSSDWQADKVTTKLRHSISFFIP